MKIYQLKSIHFTFLCILAISFLSSVNKNISAAEKTANKSLVYIVSDTRIPFWKIMAKGIKNSASSLGYKINVYNAKNSPQRELEFTAKALKEKVSGIIVSPTSSSACVTILSLAKRAGIPVVIADIGTDSGDYVSFISSDNKKGAYDIGNILVKKMQELHWDKGKVGIIAIPQKRLNGQLRTAGFMQAMNEAGIKGAGLKQQSTFSEEETYKLSKDIINNTPDLRALWLQGSDRYNGALRAIKDSGKKDKILLITFDAEPIFLKLIPKGILVGSAMQQPYLMGQKAASTMDEHLRGMKVSKNIQLPILSISTENITKKLPIINRNVLGIE